MKTNYLDRLLNNPWLPAPRENLANSPIAQALLAFISARCTLDASNYCGAPEAYKQDRLEISTQKRHAEELFAGVIANANHVKALEYLACSERNGRLHLCEDGTFGFDACQYEPTERRAAACRLLARAIVRAWIEDARGRYDMRRDMIDGRARMSFRQAICERYF